MREPVLLEADGITVRYDGMARPALQEVRVAVRAGVPLGVVGESGSGKSTLIRTLLGLERPVSGRVLYRGTDVAALRGDALRTFRRKVQMVFQDPYNSLNPRMTVGQTLGEVLTVHRLAARGSVLRVAGELLGQVGLDPSLAARYPHELSGGQRQRIGIARAISLEPEVLLADEPVSALDVSVQAQVLGLLDRLGRERGITLVLIAHDLAVVAAVCREMVVMEQGRVVEAGLARSVIEQPSHPYTRQLIAAVPQIEPLMPPAPL
ncbi:MAG TPA: ATP-binding cassette domain-containing protein [Kiritimatiellia bacterium]|nr:ATP-binding cassette domain-containing protein [Kiritimatiellia bacterium]HMP34851.1 ATP-binding cassette domain-containing protein [Kiritimatiellia bacterium]